MSLRLRSTALTTTIIGFLFGTVVAESAPQYRELGTLGGAESAAHAVSADGSMVGGGSFTGSGDVHAFLSSTSFKGLIDINPTNFRSSTVAALNANGTVAVGYANATSDLCEASDVPFRWKNGHATILKTFGGGGFAFGVSGDGSITVGESALSKGLSHAVVWTGDNKIVDLGVVAPSSSSSAYTISTDARTIAGIVDNQAVVWKVAGGSMQMTVLPSPKGALISIPLGVNANGTVIAGTTYVDAGPAPAGLGVIVGFRAIAWELKKGKWTIVIDMAKADVPTVTSVGASLVGVAGVISKARAVGSAHETVWNLNNPFHALTVDFDTAIKWSDVNFLPGLTPTPHGRVMMLAEGISLDGTTITGSSYPAPSQPPFNPYSRGFVISGLQSLGVTLKQTKWSRPAFKKRIEVTCVSPCGLEPPSRPDIWQYVQTRVSPNFADRGVSSKMMTSRLQVVLKRLLQSHVSQTSR